MLVRIETNSENYKTYIKMWQKYVEELRGKDARVDEFNPAVFYSYYHRRIYRHYFMLDNEDIVGFISVVPKRDMVFIAETFIKPEFRNKGFGTKMVEELKTIYSKKPFHLDILVNNTKAFDFWDRCFDEFDEEIMVDMEGFAVRKIYTRRQV